MQIWVTHISFFVNKTEIINDGEEFNFSDFMDVEIVDLMPKLGINVSDLLSVDEWIGVDSAVRVAQGTMPSDEDIAGDEMKIFQMLLLLARRRL